MRDAAFARQHDLEIGVADDRSAHNARAIGTVIESRERPIHCFQIPFDHCKIRKVACGNVVVHRPSA